MRFVVALASIATVVPHAVSAQELTSNSAAQGSSDSAVCMARDFVDIPQVAQEARGRRNMILATPRSVSVLEGKGFTRIECAEAGLSSARDQESSRDLVCELAAGGNEAVQEQLTRAFGASPAEMCALAERVAGPWERPRRANSDAR